MNSAVMAAIKTAVFTRLNISGRFHQSGRQRGRWCHVTRLSSVETFADGDGPALQEGGSGAALAAGALQFGEPKGAFAAGDDGAGGNDLAGLAPAFDHLGAPDLDHVAGQRRSAAWEGVEGAQATLDLGGWLLPVDGAFSLLDLVGVGDAVGGLGRALEGGHPPRPDR